MVQWRTAFLARTAKKRDSTDCSVLRHNEIEIDSNLVRRLAPAGRGERSPVLPAVRVAQGRLGHARGHPLELQQVPRRLRLDRQEILARGGWGEGAVHLTKLAALRRRCSPVVVAAVGWKERRRRQCTHSQILFGCRFFSCSGVVCFPFLKGGKLPPGVLLPVGCILRTAIKTSE